MQLDELAVVGCRAQPLLGAALRPLRISPREALILPRPLVKLEIAAPKRLIEVPIALRVVVTARTILRKFPTAVGSRVNVRVAVSLPLPLAPGAIGVENTLPIAVKIDPGLLPHLYVSLVAETNALGPRP